MMVMVSVAMAVSLTTGLGLAVSTHIDEQTGAMLYEDPIFVSGLGIEQIHPVHGFLYGTVSNSGSQEIRLESVTIRGPGSCLQNPCVLDAKTNELGECIVGKICEECSDLCALPPNSSIDLGPQLYSLGFQKGERYAVIIEAQTLQGHTLSKVLTVGVK